MKHVRIVAAVVAVYLLVAFQSVALAQNLGARQVNTAVPDKPGRKAHA
ncbi:MAG: hypothetical protein WBY44_10540 [Bryobacteraceae bacterium]|jgi:hypothetical protein